MFNNSYFFYYLSNFWPKLYLVALQLQEEKTKIKIINVNSLDCIEHKFDIPSVQLGTTSQWVIFKSEINWYNI